MMNDKQTTTMITPTKELIDFAHWLIAENNDKQSPLHTKVYEYDTGTCYYTLLTISRSEKYRPKRARKLNAMVDNLNRQMDGYIERNYEQTA